MSKGVFKIRLGDVLLSSIVMVGHVTVKTCNGMPEWRYEVALVSCCHTSCIFKTKEAAEDNTRKLIMLLG